MKAHKLFNSQYAELEIIIDQLPKELASLAANANRKMHFKKQAIYYQSIPN